MSLKYAESIKEGSYEPRQAKPRHILRAVRLRCEHVLRYEHAKATYRARAEPQTPAKAEGSLALFPQPLDRHGHSRHHQNRPTPQPPPRGATCRARAAGRSAYTGHRRALTPVRREAHQIGMGDGSPRRRRRRHPVGTPPCLRRHRDSRHTRRKPQGGRRPAPHLASRAAGRRWPPPALRRTTAQQRPIRCHLPPERHHG
jgi:hypothetical protein